MKTAPKNLVMAMIVFLILAFSNAARSQVDTLAKYEAGDSFISVPGVTIFNPPDSITSDYIVIRHNSMLQFMYIDSLNIDYTKVIVDIVSNMPDSVMLDITELGISIGNGASIQDMHITKLLITYDKFASVNEESFNSTSQLVGIYDLMGREVKMRELINNHIYIYRYENGYCEKKIFLKK
ncbi:MAG TPA: hypothetical protein PKI01_01935 [Bacteroidales bacterium]|nr:hypothetical protein [Bacteroidales bacterium]